MKQLFIVLTCLVLAACSSHKIKEPTLSGLALQQLQTREYEAPYEIVFKSIVSVLQDTGYIVENADSVTGFITAKAPSKSNSTWNPFTGLGKEHHTTKITATAEAIGTEFTKVRLNFVSIDEDSSMYGTSRVDTPIEDEEIYRNIFEKIGETIFIKQAIN
ncbi:hypothetical protein [Luteithermobacter gelatinilyticus]|uniref:hypothetical protein n=1 Tax=Luteithermobacter gelatinilyticus TaxID=2582913 RepID=UPI001105D859|nr:hypothetical protein [Luteithermobacter gelatinilyticus]